MNLSILAAQKFVILTAFDANQLWQICQHDNISIPLYFSTILSIAASFTFLTYDQSSVA